MIYYESLESSSVPELIISSSRAGLFRGAVDRPTISTSCELCDPELAGAGGGIPYFSNRFLHRLRTFNKYAYDDNRSRLFAMYFAHEVSLVNELEEIMRLDRVSSPFAYAMHRANMSVL